MRRNSILGALVASTALLSNPALAADSLKIGLVYTLSGPAAVLGEQARNAFLLATETIGDIGGLPTEVIVVDDEGKPDIAAQKARELVERDKVDFVVGPIFSNVLMAIFNPIVDSDTILISSNAGTSTLAGEGCNKNFFVTSYQNDQSHEVMGAYAQKQGYNNVFLLAPNYQAGKDALNGFKRSYKGGVAQEVYTPLGQLDFSAELAQIAAFQPDAVFTFMPGGMGVNLVKQYRQAGLDTIPFLSAFTVDEGTLPAQKEAALGFNGGASWAPDLDNPTNKEFVAAYEAKYGAVPATYAAYARDAAYLIDSAVRKTGGDLENKDALRSALMEADFQSVRGDFSFGPNHFPIQDFYRTSVVQRPDGLFQTSITETIFEDYQDNYAANCVMK